MKILGYTLFVSLVLHLTLLISIKEESREIRVKNSTPQNIAVRTKPSPPVPAPVKKPRKKKHIIADSLHRASQTQILQYSDLLPKNEGSAEQIAQEEFQGYHGFSYQHIIAASNDIEARLKIPFILRKELEEGTASVELERLSASAFRIVQLSGNPFLRAALYEVIFNQNNRKLFFEIFDSMNARVFDIRLQIQTSHYLRHNDDDFDEKIKLKDREINIVYLHKQFLTPIHPMPNTITLLTLPLPDDEAERSRRHDEAVRDRLTQNPAYLHDIHDLAVDMN